MAKHMGPIYKERRRGYFKVSNGMFSLNRADALLFFCCWEQRLCKRVQRDVNSPQTCTAETMPVRQQVAHRYPEDRERLHRNYIGCYWHSPPATRPPFVTGIVPIARLGSTCRQVCLCLLCGAVLVRRRRGPRELADLEL
jgi:hypothetical protein